MLTTTSRAQQRALLLSSRPASSPSVLRRRRCSRPRMTQPFGAGRYQPSPSSTLQIYRRGHWRAAPRGWVPARFAWAPPPAAEDICDVCGGASAPGDALLGCIDACGRLFHLGCLDNPPKRRPRSGALLCPDCRAAAPARALKDSPAQKRARKAAPKEAPPLSEYERERQRNIESNQQKLAELGLEPAVSTKSRPRGGRARGRGRGTGDEAWRSGAGS